MAKMGGDTLETVPSKYINITLEEVHGRIHCNTQRHRHSKCALEKKIHTLATCPWTFVRNIDPNRKPEVLIEAKCACTSPANDVNQICYSVTQYMMVYRRTHCYLGMYQYKRVWEPVIVACTAGMKLTPTRLNDRVMRQ